MTISILNYYGLQAKKGEVGIELEVEGTNLPDAIQGWNKVADGSLRGESCEYVLKQPVAREDVKKYLQRITKAYKDSKAKINFSNRTSTHIHINVQSFGFLHLFNMITIYLTLEELLVKFCGETREGNLFCLRAKDAEYLTISLETIINARNWGALSTNSLRYAAMNVAAVPKYGSLEFRAMKGTDDMALIEDWANILLAIKDAATQFASPVNIVETLSAEGEENFLNMVLGQYAERVHCKGMAEMIMEGVRSAQDLAYCASWDDIDKDVKKKYRNGDRVMLNDGPYNDRPGTISDVDGDTYRVNLDEGDGWWARAQSLTPMPRREAVDAPPPPRPGRYQPMNMAAMDRVLNEGRERAAADPTMFRGQPIAVDGRPLEAPQAARPRKKKKVRPTAVRTDGADRAQIDWNEMAMRIREID